MRTVACVSEVVMPCCDDEQLQVAEDEQQERSEVRPETGHVLEDAGDPDWAG